VRNTCRELPASRRTRGPRSGTGARRGGLLIDEEDGEASAEGSRPTTKRARFSWTTGGLLMVICSVAAIHRYYDPFITSFRYQWRAAKWAGLAQVYPIASYPGFKAQGAGSTIKTLSDNALIDLATSAQGLNLLLASGWRLIGCEKYPGLLYDALRARTAGFPVTVLLLHPDSESARARAARCGMTTTEYTNGTVAVLSTLGQLRDVYELAVEVYYYDEEPIWQMVISESEIWMLCASNNVPTRMSPV
jgi:hypothetical protein